MTQDQGENSRVEVPAQEDFATGAMQGTIQQFLFENIGRYVVCEFYIGQTLTERRGYLYTVGEQYIVLTAGMEGGGDAVVCDASALRFVAFPASEGDAATTALIAGTEPACARSDARQARQAAFNYAKRQSMGKL